MAKINLAVLSSAVRAVLSDVHAPVPTTGNASTDVALQALSHELRESRSFMRSGPVANLWSAAPPAVSAR
jgi:hypothetical protein